jgi:hypothetical protein
MGKHTMTTTADRFVKRTAPIVLASESYQRALARAAGNLWDLYYRHAPAPVPPAGELYEDALARAAALIASPTGRGTRSESVLPDRSLH